jgi:uncharacterized protein DUF6478
MRNRVHHYLSRIRHFLSLKRWDIRLKRARRAGLSDLRILRTQTRQVQRRIDAINHIAVSRLTLPVIGSKAIRKPPKTEWAHRPEAWSGPVKPTGVAAIRSKTRIGNELTLFHDCPQSEITLRQVRNTRAEDFAPFGITLDVFNFMGSFLSLAIEMPKDSVVGLRRNHLLRLSMIIESEKPLEIFARLNLRHGPNTEQIVRELDLNASEIWVEFDLFYTRFNENRGESMWIDLIFEGPSMNQITIRDVTLLRRPRAEI